MGFIALRRSAQAGDGRPLCSVNRSVPDITESTLHASVADRTCKALLSAICAIGTRNVHSVRKQLPSNEHLYNRVFPALQQL